MMNLDTLNLKKMSKFIYDWKTDSPTGAGGPNNANVAMANIVNSNNLVVAGANEETISEVELAFEPGRKRRNVYSIGGKSWHPNYKLFELIPGIAFKRVDWNNKEIGYIHEQWCLILSWGTWWWDIILNITNENDKNI
jgi:hypothetical protein